MGAAAISNYLDRIDRNLFRCVFPPRAKLASLSVTLRPKSMRQEVCKSKERFPASGRMGQSVIESRVDDQILTKRAGNCPEIAYGVSILEGL